ECAHPVQRTPRDGRDPAAGGHPGRRAPAGGVMPTEVVLPRLGLTQDDGTVVRWFKAEGSRVAKGEPLFEVMTDKATLEIEAPASGMLLRILVAEGGTVPVSTP